MPQALLIGLAAGATSAVHFASAATGSLFAVMVLFVLAPLPVAIAGLGWGWGSAATGAVIAAIGIGAFAGPRAAMFHAAVIGVPAAAFSYLALLNRTMPDGSQEWYPIGRVLLWMSGWAGALAALALVSAGGDMEALRTAVGEAFDKMMVLRGADERPGGPAGAGEPRITAADKRTFVDIMVVLFPWAIATAWMSIAVLNAWAGAHVTRLSARLMRPWPDLATLDLPAATPLVFAGAIAVTMVPGMTGLVASGFASALLFAYMLVGLAVLHAVTRGLAARPAILGLAYGALLVASPFSTLLVAMLGLGEPWLKLRQRFAGRAGPPPSPPAAPPPRGPWS